MSTPDELVRSMQGICSVALGDLVREGHVAVGEDEDAVRVAMVDVSRRVAREVNAHVVGAALPNVDKLIDQVAALPGGGRGRDRRRVAAEAKRAVRASLGVT